MQSPDLTIMTYDLKTIFEQEDQLTNQNHRECYLKQGPKPLSVVLTNPPQGMTGCLDYAHLIFR
jgi:hypothetical protein